jgi:hypothetical protein
VKTRKIPLAVRLSVVAVAVAGAAVVNAGAAFASVNDSFEIWTNDADGCGSVVFVDYGEGAPGDGNNDDYLEFTDNCEDHHGVKVWAWHNGVYLGGMYNGNGVGKAKVWDPFGNVAAKDTIKVKICLVDGDADPTPSHCEETTVQSYDG